MNRLTLLLTFLSTAAFGTEAEDYTFLVENMPAKDRGTVGEAILRSTVALAREAREAAPWREEISDDLFRNYILPYSSIGEEVDDWRPLFRRTFWPMVKDCRSIGEAAARLHACVWTTLGVRYDTRRDKADQSPFHSMRIHMASCTGLAILEIDAFRACGIPARLTGCNWTPIPGNHSWTEYYANGAWHFFGDPEGDGPAPVDKAWFTDYAALADASEPRTRIYATRWSPNAARTRFWCTWRAEDHPSDVWADDVTDAFRRFRSTLTEARIAFVARDGAGRRIQVPFRLILAGSGKVVAEAVTYDETHDMNDHVILTQPRLTKAIVQTKDSSGTYHAVAGVEFTEKPTLCVIPLSPEGK